MIPIASHCLFNMITVCKASCVVFKAGMFGPMVPKNTHYKMAFMKRRSAAFDVFNINIYELSSYTCAL